MDSIAMSVPDSRNYTAITSESQFDELLSRTKADSTLLLVALFCASWHEPSQDLLPVLAKIADQHPPALFQCVSIDAEQFETLSQRYSQYVNSVPTCLFIRSGAVVDHCEGTDAPTLAERTIQQMRKASFAAPTQPIVAAAAPASGTTAAASQTAAQSTQSPAEQLKARLQRLVSAHPVMLFIKGTPAAPRCGFTRKLLQLMSDLKVTFGSFDILSDEQVRSGLKEYSSWPTFPQVYIDGEFQGGLDVVQELAATGELIKLIPSHCIEGGHVAGASPADDVDARCDKLLSSHRVMLFMKGDRHAPQCGFSAKTVALLAELSPSLEYGTFDILTDQAVREHLKKKLEWQTYPMLCIDGELVGGLDVLNEMNAQGELAPMLVKQ